MIAIIERKRYNTETATEIAEYSNGCSGSDFHHLYEALYQTPNGAWFIKYAGGPMSRYAVSCGQNSWSGSKGLRALTQEEAFEWLQEHGKADALEAHFADKLSDA